MSRTHLLIALLAALPACGAVDARSEAVVVRDEIAALRAEGPPALQRLLARWDAMAPGPERDALAERIDRVAGQRYATASRMFWYTDLAAAKAEAKRTGKPILSLRMLGRLDEELSCANSRYFRIALYANTELSKFLRASFVLHWSSERPVPKVTVDFGDGRKLERTLTGNSAHYVLDADGRPIDVLPGLYAPAMFRKELETTLELARRLAREPDRDGVLAAHHRAAVETRSAEWVPLARAYVPAPRISPEAIAQMQTVTKASREIRTYQVVDFKVALGDLPTDSPAWAQIGAQLLPPPRPGEPTQELVRAGGVLQPRTGPTDRAVALPQESPVTVGEILDAHSKALIARMGPLAWGDRPILSTGQDLDGKIASFERDIVADTAINEYQLRPQIRERLAANPRITFGELNTFVYDTVFHTPSADPWLGLAPEELLALPHDGLVMTLPVVAARSASALDPAR